MAQISASLANQAREILKKSTDENGFNLYEHLSDVLGKIFAHLPSNAMDTFEQWSARTKQEKGHASAGRAPQAEEVRGVPWATAMSKVLETATAREEKLQKKNKDRRRGEDSSSESESMDEMGEDVHNARANIPDLQLEATHFESAGVAIGTPQDIFRLAVSIKTLIHTQKDVQNARLFGKITGIEQDYIILETEMNNQPQEDDLDAPPQEPGVAPTELGTGVNRHVYFVCNLAGGPWTRLPDATPAQIRAARQITKLFTGRLDAPIKSYPPFPGNESNYLRAQIARISAGATISPQGFYQMRGEKDDDAEQAEEEQAEEDSAPKAMREAANYRAPPLAKLLQPESWVHHENYILPQGRTTFWRQPKVKERKEEEDGGESEEVEKLSDTSSQAPEEDLAPAEEGPELLTSVAADSAVGSLPPFILRATSLLAPHAKVFARSVRWPGATCIAFGSQFANIYIGNGQKYSGSTYTPPPPPSMQLEPHTLREQTDPSVEAERELFERKHPKAPEVPADENGSQAGSKTGDEAEEGGGSQASGEDLGEGLDDLGGEGDLLSDEELGN